jgi:hypothetical protein
MLTPSRYLLIPLLLFTAAATATANGNRWIDSASLTLGKDRGSNDADVYRLAVQNKWERSWFTDGAWFVGGYWDVELAYLESDVSDSKNDEIFDLGLTPMFRLQRDTGLSSGVSPFAEAGIGPHLISETRLGDKEYSTAFQFGSVFGLGLGFGERGQYELSYRFQHVSNASIKKPNDGMDMHLLRIGYSFE